MKLTHQSDLPQLHVSRGLGTTYTVGRCQLWVNNSRIGKLQMAQIKVEGDQGVLHHMELDRDTDVLVFVQQLTEVFRDFIAASMWLDPTVAKVYADRVQRDLTKEPLRPPIAGP